MRTRIASGPGGWARRLEQSNSGGPQGAGNATRSAPRTVALVAHRLAGIGTVLVLLLLGAVLSGCGPTRPALPSGTLLVEGLHHQLDVPPAASACHRSGPATACAFGAGKAPVLTAGRDGVLELHGPPGAHLHVQVPSRTGADGITMHRSSLRLHHARPGRYLVLVLGGSDAWRFELNVR